MLPSLILLVSTVIFLKFILFVLLATTFHQTAVVFVFVYWITRLKFNCRNLLLVTGVSLLAIAFPTPLINLANEMLEEEYSGTVDSGGFVAALIFIIALIVCYIYYISHEEDFHSPLVFVLIIGFATYLMRYTGVRIAERISFYFAFSQIALIPLASKLFIKKDRIIVNMLIVLLAVGLFVYRLRDSGFLPYAFYWD